MASSTRVPCRSALVRLPILATNEHGEAVTAPTVEFRLPDGSAHPHLLLAGVAQALLAGRETRDLESLLAATASARTGGPDTSRVTQLPRTLAAVAQQLATHRSRFERYDVFPPHMLDALVQNTTLG